MDTIEPIVAEKLPESNTNSESVSALDSLFEERDAIKTNEPEIKSIKKEEKPSPEKKVVKDDLNLDKKEKLEEKTKATNLVPVKEDDEDDSHTVEVERLKKALNDSQKWGHTNNKRLKKVLGAVNALKDAGALRDDEFERLNELLQTGVDEEEINAPKISNSPMGKLIDIANKRVDDLAQLYEHDPLFKKKIEAFDLFMEDCSQEEKDDILDELEKLEKTDFKLVKRMFEIGEKYYNEERKEIDDAGGLKNLLASKNSTIEKMQKKLDKLQNKLSQYEDYDRPTNRIDELGDTVNVTTNKPGDTFGQLLEERDRKKG